MNKIFSLYRWIKLDILLLYSIAKKWYSYKISLDRKIVIVIVFLIITIINITFNILPNLFKNKIKSDYKLQLTFVKPFNLYLRGIFDFLDFLTFMFTEFFLIFVKGEKTHIA